MIDVIGAGVAGSIVARDLALRGQRVRLLERERFPRAKVCGGCVGPLAMQLLHDAGLGSLPERLGGTPVERFAWSASRQTACRELGTIQRSILRPGASSSGAGTGRRDESDAGSVAISVTFLSTSSLLAPFSNINVS